MIKKKVSFIRDDRAREAFFVAPPRRGAVSPSQRVRVGVGVRDTEQSREEQPMRSLAGPKGGACAGST